MEKANYRNAPRATCSVHSGTRPTSNFIALAIYRLLNSIIFRHQQHLTLFRARGHCVTYCQSSFQRKMATFCFYHTKETHIPTETIQSFTRTRHTPCIYRKANPFKGHSRQLVSFTFTYHTRQFIIILFTIFTITTCIFSYSFSLSL